MDTATDISGLTFISGAGDGKQTACLMSARSLLDGRPFGDQHPSAVLRRIGIRINDGPWWNDDVERTRVLLPLALDKRLCATKCDASPKAEKKRAGMAAHWALSWAAPFALDAAADALQDKKPKQAKILRGHAEKLRRKPTRENALAARAAAVAYAAAATIAAATIDAYADAAVAYAAAATAARKQARREIRDSLIALFGQMLDVRCEASA